MRDIIFADQHFLAVRIFLHQPDNALRQRHTEIVLLGVLEYDIYAHVFLLGVLAFGVFERIFPVVIDFRRIPKRDLLDGILI
ncbi:MAG: hypothetical protein MAGBODY4_00570 [Candidatus Marinimicrobia bacterium]|nr:hypothetical protein [Candidatus Neomarinimicrobiota bacterium]